MDPDPEVLQNTWFSQIIRKPQIFGYYLPKTSKSSKKWCSSCGVRAFASLSVQMCVCIILDLIIYKAIFPNEKYCE